MERPLCPLCKTKHFVRDGCTFKKGGEENVPGPSVGDVVTGAAHPKNAETVLVCPVCEARKKRDRERVRKWRAKK